MSEPHLCKDLRKRWERRERMKAAVVKKMCAEHAWLQDDGFDGGFYENVARIAEEIVMTLVKMGVTEDV